MCGRFALGIPPKRLEEYFGTANQPQYEPRWNVAPTQLVPVVLLEGDTRVFRMLQWGLVPFWAKDPAIGSRQINARAETVPEKPAFRAAFRHRRCLIPAQGFYEWKAAGKTREPYFIQRTDGAPLALAGLYEHWEGDGRVIDSFAIITGNANELLAPIHERMPVIIAPEEFDLWLGQGHPGTAELLPLLLPYPARELAMRKVSDKVNSVRIDDPTLIAPA